MQRADDFRAALDEHLHALQARDATRFAATLGRDAFVVDGAGTIRRGTDAVAQAHEEWFAASSAWQFDYEVRVTREFDGAALALLDVAYREESGAVPARFLLTLVFERGSDGRWSFVFDQNTPLTAVTPS